jgi:hypothetical protein
VTEKRKSLKKTSGFFFCARREAGQVAEFMSAVRPVEQ